MGGPRKVNYKDIDLLVEQGEGARTEFKRKISSPKKIARTMISFANSGGGIILFGVDDDGTIIGVESEKTEVELIRTAGMIYADPPVMPSIEIIPYRGKDIVAALINESKDKPHYYVESDNGENHPGNRVYIRVNDKSIVASNEMVNIMHEQDPDAEPMTITIGNMERRLFDYLEQHEHITLQQFMNIVNISERRASRTFVNLVRAGILQIHTDENKEYYTMIE
jgi:predicted HTH transcriptional regulator